MLAAELSGTLGPGGSNREEWTDPEPPAFGATGGTTIDGGRHWRWSRVVARSPEARIQQIEIAVAPEEGGPGRAALTVFRRAPS